MITAQSRPWLSRKCQGPKSSKRSENQVALNLKRTIKIKLKRSHPSQIRRSRFASETRWNKRSWTRIIPWSVAKSWVTFRAPALAVRILLVPRLQWQKCGETLVTKNIIRNLISSTEGLLSEPWLSISRGSSAPTSTDGESLTKDCSWPCKRSKTSKLPPNLVNIQSCFADHFKFVMIKN